MTKAVVYQTALDMPRAELPTKHNFSDLTNKVFGRLTVIHYAGKDERGNTKWATRCSCPEQTLKVVYSHNLMAGNTVSCGCSATEKLIARQTTHGLAHVELAPGAPRSLMNTFKNMVSRCTDRTNRRYADYGGRGIQCKFGSITEFAEYVFSSLGPRPKGHSLDRIDNDGNYEPGNLQWATLDVQGRKKRNNRLVCYKGNKIPLIEAAELSGTDYYLAWNRLRAGWSDEEALVAPNQGKEHLVTYNGQVASITAAAELAGLNEEAVRSRLKRGWSEEKALSTPTWSHIRTVEFEGKQVNLKTACRLAGIGYTTVLHRLDTLGWPLERALTTPSRKAKPTQPAAEQPSQSPHPRVKIIPPRPLSEFAVAGANP